MKMMKGICPQLEEIVAVPHISPYYQLDFAISPNFQLDFAISPSSQYMKCYHPF
jgi:hypothetical protein